MCFLEENDGCFLLQLQLLQLFFFEGCVFDFSYISIYILISYKILIGDGVTLFFNCNNCNCNGFRFKDGFTSSLQGLAALDWQVVCQQFCRQLSSTLQQRLLDSFPLQKVNYLP